MKIKKKITIDTKSLIVVIIAALIAVLIGLSYAWLRITKSSETINKIKAGSLEMSLDDSASKGIKLVNEVPKSYQQGMKTEEYTFTLTNTGTTTNDYTIYLDDVLTYMNDDNQEVTITKENKLEDSKIRYILLKDGEAASADKSKLLSTTTERDIDTGKIESNQTVNYSLRVWIDSKSSNEVMGKQFNAKLRVEATQAITKKIIAEDLEIQLNKELLNGIAITDSTPKNYEEGLETKTYTFALTNTSEPTNYEISLSDLDTYRNENNEEVKINNSNRIDDSKIKYLLLKDDEIATQEKANNLTDGVIDKGIIEQNQTIEYKLRLWIDSEKTNDESEILGKVASKELKLTKGKTILKLCKRATTLHTETCNQTDKTYYCSGDGYAYGTKLTYGNLGTKGVLTSGDAFDCDVNGDGVYDSNKERFYYVSDMTNGITQDSNTAVLIYYNNVSGGKASANSTYAYDSSGKNNNGPVTAIKQLPTTSQWKNVNLTNTKRQITTELGTISTTGGTLPTEFDYTGYSTRLLTYQEVNTGCYREENEKISKKCRYLMENTKYSSNNLKTYGWWLETAESSDKIYSWIISGQGLNIFKYNSNIGLWDGVRPAIEVDKSDISY